MTITGDKQRSVDAAQSTVDDDWGEVNQAEDRGAESAEQPSPSLEEIHLLLEDARSKADDHYNEVLRARADLDNMRKRAARDVENAHKFALEGFAKELLPVKDSLELGLSAAREAEGSHEKVVEGMELTLKMLTAAMEKFNIHEINPVGQPFDPERHQAMVTQPSDEYEPNTVITVYQKGYLLNDRLVRPAMVVVAQG